MVVASGTADRQSQKCLGRRSKHVVQFVRSVLSRFQGIDFILPGPQSMKSCGNHSLLRPIAQFVPGELFEDESIVRFVAVQGFNHVVAITPDAWFGTIPFVPV